MEFDKLYSDLEIKLPVNLILSARTNRCKAINLIKKDDRWSHEVCLQVGTINNNKSVLNELFIQTKPQTFSITGLSLPPKHHIQRHFIRFD